MAKKKTSVLLPGSISDLVKGLQSGAQPNQNSREQQGDEAREEQHQREETVQDESEGTAEQSATDQVESAAVDERPLSPTPDSAFSAQWRDPSDKRAQWCAAIALSINCLHAGCDK